ncbi:MAG: hypothetical protein D6732_24640 [Methanobacteriota archaeon]|nr:MAG: hypothetical protein D6732_24640 [Euryarchaeota archaeon]
MQSFSTHPIFRQLPYKLKHKPDEKKIRRWLRKKYRTTTLLMYASFIMAVIQFISFVLFYNVSSNLGREFDVFENIMTIGLIALLFFGGVYMRHFRGKYVKAEEELKMMLHNPEQNPEK